MPVVLRHVLGGDALHRGGDPREVLAPLDDRLGDLVDHVGRRLGVRDEDRRAPGWSPRPRRSRTGAYVALGMTWRTKPGLSSFGASRCSSSGTEIMRSFIEVPRSSMNEAGTVVNQPIADRLPVPDGLGVLGDRAVALGAEVVELHAVDLQQQLPPLGEAGVAPRAAAPTALPLRSLRVLRRRRRRAPRAARRSGSSWRRRAACRSACPSRCWCPRARRPARSSSTRPRSVLSLRIFSMLTRAAPGSTSTSSSGNFFLITSAVAAAIGVQRPAGGAGREDEARPSAGRRRARQRRTRTRAAATSEYQSQGFGSTSSRASLCTSETQ